MLITYFDASALVKRYVPEAGTDIVNEAFRLVPLDRMACSWLGVLELVSIVQRKRNAGRIAQALYQQAFVELSDEVLQADGFAITAVDTFDLTNTMRFIVQYNINATDAVILRSALTLQQTLRATRDDVVLWTADKRLVRAAQREALPVLDPEVASIDEVRRVIAAQGEQ